MNRRFGLLSVLTLLVLSVTLTACLGGLPQQPAPVPEKAVVAVATAPVYDADLGRDGNQAAHADDRRQQSDYRDGRSGR